MKCIICNNSGNSEFLVREMMFGTREEFTYRMCTECSCIWINEIPRDIGNYYSDGYYSLSQKLYPNNPMLRYIKKQRNQYAISGKSLVGKLAYQFAPTQRLGTIQNIAKDSKILDVGSGSGALVCTMRDMGYTQVIGIDPYIDDEIHYSNGASVYKKSIFDVHETYDVIMLHHVLEHISDQENYFKQLYRLLNNEGFLLIRTPVAGNYAWDTFGVNWVQLDAPRHLVIHSEKSLRIISEKTGFFIESIDYDSTSFQYWGSIQYQNNIPLRSHNSHAISKIKSIFTRKQIREYEIAAQELNHISSGDQAVFIIRKL